MYRIRKENLDELREGKTIVYLSNLTGYARPYLNDIFLGKMLVNEEVAKKILVLICDESYKLKTKLDKYDIETMLKHFFKKIE